MSHNLTTEPWTQDDRMPTHIRGHEDPLDKRATWIIGEMRNKRDTERAVACVNACAGFEDPSAAIDALRAVFCTGSTSKDPGHATITRALFDRIRAMVEAADAATNR